MLLYDGPREVGTAKDVRDCNSSPDFDNGGDPVHFDCNSLPVASIIKARLGSRFIYAVF
jgi:hypothetical protein